MVRVIFSPEGLTFRGSFWVALKVAAARCPLFGRVSPGAYVVAFFLGVLALSVEMKNSLSEEGQSTYRPRGAFAVCAHTHVSSWPLFLYRMYHRL